MDPVQGVLIGHQIGVFGHWEAQLVVFTELARTRDVRGLVNHTPTSVWKIARTTKGVIGVAA